MQVASQDAQQHVDGLLTWLADTEDLFNNLRPVSVDKDTLNEQIQAHRVISSDIDNHRAQVTSLQALLLSLLLLFTCSFAMNTTHCCDVTVLV